MHHNIRIKTKNISYSILVTNSLHKDLSTVLNKIGYPKNLFVVIDANVFKFHKKKIQSLLKSCKCRIKIFVLKSGEHNKSLSTVQSIYENLIKNKFVKDTVLVSIGGGIIGDISGFVASTFMRGIRLIHIPTTITSAVDSSIGGKTGVNFLDLKNLSGSIYHPEAVLIDREFLKTLPVAEIRSGLGEVIKYCFLSDREFFNYVHNNLDAISNLSETEFLKVLRECILIKSYVVEADENESGLRKILNFGHTFAHAIESVSNYKIKHGEAVVAGIVSALILSFELGYIREALYNRLLKLPIEFGIPKKIQTLDENKIFQKMNLDKKNRNNEIRLVLLKNVGELLIDVIAGKGQVLKAILEMKKLVTV